MIGRERRAIWTAQNGVVSLAVDVHFVFSCQLQVFQCYWSFDIADRSILLRWASFLRSAPRVLCPPVCPVRVLPAAACWLCPRLLDGAHSARTLFASPPPISLAAIPRPSLWRSPSTKMLICVGAGCFRVFVLDKVCSTTLVVLHTFALDTIVN